MNAGAHLLLFVASVSAHATEVVLETFDAPRNRYSHTMGGEFPGARATFAWTAQGRESDGALRIDYDFSEGGRYCQWLYSGWVPEKSAAMRFSANAPAGTHVIVRVVDSTGQYHQFGVKLEATDWQRVDVPLEVARATGHWGGANDGVIHEPLGHVFIGPEAGDVNSGTLIIDRVAVETSMTDGEIAESRLAYFLTNARLTVSAAQPGLLFWPEDEHELTLSVEDVPDGVDEVVVAMACRDAYGNPADGLPPQALLAREAGFRATLAAPAEPGYREVEYELTARTGDKQRSGAGGRFSFGAIPGAETGREPHSPFGVNTHFNQGWNPELGRIVKKAGIAWIRDGEANLEDRALPVAKANNLSYMPCFTWYRRPLEKNRDVQGNWDFSDVADWHRQYAEKYGADIDAYDLVNEPHGSWSEVLGGDWSGGPWQDVFVLYGRQVTQAIKAGDPGAIVLWEDIDQLLWYRRFFELGAGDTIDVISPHPYNLHRSRPLPEEQPILEQLPEFQDFVKQHELPWEVWSGEVGFGSFRPADETPTGFYTPHTELEQAQMLVRMMVLQLSGGVRRIFWYDFYNDGTEPTNPEHNFGLIRHDRTPKPAIVAYAYLIHRLAGCRWLGRYAVGGGADALAFVSARSDTPTVIAWLRSGTKTESFRIPGDADALTVTDIFGASKRLPVENHTIALELSEMPVYVDGLTMEDVQHSLSARPDA